MSVLLSNKLKRIALNKIEAWYGSIRYDLEATLNSMAKRPFELHLELTNICNANCIFCPYQYLKAPKEVMTDTVFYKAVTEFGEISGGSVGLTPRVGDALIDPNFLRRVRYLREQPFIDRIFLTTNGILLDKVGIREILMSGLSTINISTSGFDKESYERIYRTKQYDKMKNNVYELLEHNEALGRPVNICLGLRVDRPASEVVKDADFQPIFKFNPDIDITLAFSSGGNKIKRKDLRGNMKLRSPRLPKETCANLYNGAVIFPSGKVGGCACLTAIDSEDLVIGDILSDKLIDIWVGKKMKEIREQFEKPEKLNPTCLACDVGQPLDIYRKKEGRIRAELNEQRSQGTVVKRTDRSRGIFAGG